MSASPAPIKFPAILIANHFLDGDVVFWTGSSWSQNPRDAAIADDAAAALAFESEARSAFARNEVVDAALVDITRDASGQAVPNHFRERFKIKGPSNRADLGKQAEFPKHGDTL